jgi:hypothetical protein
MISSFKALRKPSSSRFPSDVLSQEDRKAVGHGHRNKVTGAASAVRDGAGATRRTADQQQIRPVDLVARRESSACR